MPGLSVQPRTENSTGVRKGRTIPCLQPPDPWRQVKHLRPEPSAQPETGWRRQGGPDTELLCPLADREEKDSGNSHGRDRQGQQRKYSEQGCVQALRRNAFRSEVPPGSGWCPRACWDREPGWFQRLPLSVAWRFRRILPEKSRGRSSVRKPERRCEPVRGRRPSDFVSATTPITVYSGDHWPLPRSKEIRAPDRIVLFKVVFRHRRAEYHDPGSVRLVGPGERAPLEKGCTDRFEIADAHRPGRPTMALWRQVSCPRL